MTAQLPGPVPDFASPDLARTTPPLDWFQIITEGRIDQLMPPFADSLTEAERWDLVAFLYTLSTPASQIDDGKSIYTANCVRCHGEGGAGDGPDAMTLDKPSPAFTDLAYMSAHTQVEFFNAVTLGVGEAMPQFETSLTESQRWAAVDYVRAFSYAYVEPGAPQPEQTGAVLGSVVNGTQGAAVPAGLEVTLHGFDDINLVSTLTTTVDANGAFAFAGVPYIAGRQFLVTAEYNGVTYGSDISGFEGGQPTLNIALRIYDSTVEAAALRVERFHMFVEFTAQGRATIGELFLLSNLGDRTYVAPKGSPTVAFALPSGADDFNMQDGQEGVDYVRTAEGFAVMQPVVPGSGATQVLVSFSLPYNRSLDFAQKMLYPVEVANILVSDLQVKLTGEGLQSLGTQDFQGVQFQSFNRDNLAAGDTLTFQVSGRPSTSGPAGLAATDPVSMAAGLGALGAVVLGIGYWWYRRTRRRTDGSLNREDLLQAIVELDDAFAAGEVDEREYHRERAWLKAQLKRVWE
jgi:mono/diheme cytochrome c family protein